MNHPANISAKLRSRSSWIALALQEESDATQPSHIALNAVRRPLSEGDALLDRLTFMRETDMAVVISPAQNEIADFAAKVLDIRPHRKRMVEEDLEKKFADPQDHVRVVFVCAMWMTGFDAPSVSTIYLDKLMRNHTLSPGCHRPQLSCRSQKAPKPLVPGFRP